jgi:hypothetical protein
MMNKRKQGTCKQPFRDTIADAEVEERRDVDYLCTLLHTKGFFMISAEVAKRLKMADARKQIPLPLVQVDGTTSSRAAHSASTHGNTALSTKIRGS